MTFITHRATSSSKALAWTAKITALFAAVLALASCTTPQPSPTPSEATARTESALVGQDGEFVVAATNTIVNQYAVLTADAAAGATTLTVDAVGNLDSADFGALGGGDLVMVIQMQGATIDLSNTTTYGNVSAVNNAGRYEFVGVTGVTSTTTLNLACALQHAYDTSGHVQVVRVPQFTNLTMTGGITAPAWNGSTGGVVAIHAQNTLQMNGDIIATGIGFRGGASDNAASVTGYAGYRTTLATQGGEKGESIAGSPASLANGRYGRGAPANGGGGGNAHNAGGGGGSNGRRGLGWTGQGVMLSSVTGGAAWTLEGALANSDGGGRGGYSWSANDLNALTVGPNDGAWGGDSRRQMGGLGGRPLDNDPTGRLFLGGGGGAGDANNGNDVHGGNGGGLVFLMAGTITGTGTILANGQSGGTTTTAPGDAPGGGGGGGTVVVQATTLSGVTIHADGGPGGIQTANDANEAEGPGGGGGGGFVALSDGTLTTVTAAGAPAGTTTSNAVTEFPSNGATYGNSGQTDGSAATVAYCVDASAPDTTITSTHPASTRATDATFTFTSPDTTATFECSLDGANYAACTSPWALTGLSEAQHTFSVRARDLSGNVDNSPDSRTWTVDLTGPAATISAGPANPTRNATAGFTLTSNETNVTFECQLDSGAFAACNPDASFDVTDGPHSLVIRATDAAGNVGPDSAPWTWTVDRMSPTATIADGPDDPTRDTTAVFALTSNESSVTFECQIDAGTFAACSATPSFTVTAGTHALVVRATDAAGNVSVDSAPWAWTVDLTPPTAAIATGPASPTRQTLAGFTLSSNDTDATFDCQLDGAAFTACSAAPSFTAAEGPHTLVVRATDVVGNVSVDSMPWAWTVDLTPPSASIDSGPVTPTNQTTVTFTWSSRETPVTFQCSLDGADFVACPDNGSFTVTEGTHSLTVRATDAAGNVGGNSTPFPFDVVVTGPTASIASGPASLTRETTAIFSLSANRPNVTFQCSLDGADFAACAASQSYTVADGAHTLVVHATDSLGNVGPDTAAYPWTVDSRGPVASIATHPANPTNQTTSAFTLTADESNVTYECRLDGADFAPCAASVSFTVGEGSHSLAVRATDAAGNLGPISDAFGWNVDTSAPATTISTGPVASTDSTAAVFTLTSPEQNVTYECKLDSGAFASCTANPTFTVTLGAHTLTARATDAAGNVGAESNTWAWAVTDVVPPVGGAGGEGGVGGEGGIAGAGGLGGAEIAGEAGVAGTAEMAGTAGLAATAGEAGMAGSAGTAGEGGAGMPSGGAATGGVPTGGSAPTGGTPASGGTTATGGSAPQGGSPTGGTSAAGGTSALGGTSPAGGTSAAGGTPATGGNPEATGGAPTIGGSQTVVLPEEVLGDNVEAVGGGLCAYTGPRPTRPLGLVVLLGLAAVVVRRRRRR